MWNPLFLSLLSLLPLTQDVEQDLLYKDLNRIERLTPEVLVVRAVKPAVVFIETEVAVGVQTFFGVRNQVLEGSGSGVVVHADGYIVTNYHVVEGARSITVTFDGDPKRYPAELASFVRSEDLALLQIELPGGPRPETGLVRPRGFPTVRMGTSADLMPGERVVAIGNPFGQTHTVSTGIISGLHRDVPIPDRGLHFQDLIQTDASINFGNSGGPLLNIRGELIGINSAVNSQAENIGFAIPVDRVREVLNDLLFPQARKIWLGFELAPGEPLTVGRVWADGPADLAGVCEGDQLTAFAGRTVSTGDEFLHATLELEPGEPVTVALETRGRGRQTLIQTWDRVDGVLFERLGATVRDVRLGRQSWIVVDRLRSGGPAQETGLKAGDLIPAILPEVPGLRSPLRVRSRQTMAQLLARLDPEVVIHLDVYRDDDENGEFTRDELYKGSITVR